MLGFLGPGRKVANINGIAHRTERRVANKIQKTGSKIRRKGLLI